MTARALVRSSVAPIHAEARVSSVQISQRLGGHAVTVLETQGEWLRVRGEDQYDGWIHRGYLELTDGEEERDAGRQLSLGCTVLDGTGVSARALPLGAWLAPNETIMNGQAVDSLARPALFPRDAAAIATTAVERFAGTPYQWGGISPWGADCSGLVQTAFWLHGVQLPRDAWQQAELGADAGGDPGVWLAGDLAFFSDRADRRITHVGIALGDSQMVHLALGRGGYALEQLDATDDPYVTTLVARLVVAKRVM